MEFWEHDYELIQQLSRANSKRFGTTSLLVHKTSGEKVILKTVSTSNEIGFQQLQNESTFHFNISGLPYILETNLSSVSFSILKKNKEGIPLNEFWRTVKRRNRLETLKRIVASLASLLMELEQETIIHSDIKPENILVNLQGNALSCSLIDFGLAFRKDQIPSRKTLFQLAYAPPEIILNQLECANSSSDVFSLCLVIYKLWTGNLPFSASNPALMTQLQITYPIPKHWKINKKMWKVLEKGLIKHQFQQAPNRMSKASIQHALTGAIELRYQNIRAFEAEIQQL